jgi:hypothetical protein
MNYWNIGKKKDENYRAISRNSWPKEQKVVWGISQGLNSTTRVTGKVGRFGRFHPCH